VSGTSRNSTEVQQQKGKDHYKGDKDSARISVIKPRLFTAAHFLA
jgi:hypothetical protein